MVGYTYPEKVVNIFDSFPVLRSYRSIIKARCTQNLNLVRIYLSRRS